jgi:hypothetical protein
MTIDVHNKHDQKSQERVLDQSEKFKQICKYVYM